MQQQRIRSFILYTLAAVCAAGWSFFALRVLLPATLPFWLGLLIAAGDAAVFPSAALKAPPRRRLCHRAFLYTAGTAALAAADLAVGAVLFDRRPAAPALQDGLSTRAGRFLRVAVGAAGPLCA